MPAASIEQMEELKKLLQTNMDLKMVLAHVDTLLTSFQKETILENKKYEKKRNCCRFQCKMEHIL